MSLIIYKEIDKNESSIINKYIDVNSKEKDELFKNYCIKIFEFLKMDKLDGELSYIIENNTCIISKDHQVLQKGWFSTTCNIKKVPLYEIKLISINTDITHYLDISENNLNELILLNNTLINALNEYATSIPCTPSNSFKANEYLIRDEEYENDECESNIDLEDVEQNQDHILIYDINMNENDGERTPLLQDDIIEHLINKNDKLTYHIDALNTENDITLNEYTINKGVNYNSDNIKYNKNNYKNNYKLNAVNDINYNINYLSNLGYTPNLLFNFSSGNKYTISQLNPPSKFIEELNKKLIPNPWDTDDYLDELKQKLKDKDN